MRKFLLLLLLSTIYFSCQKVLQWDIESSGTLLKDANNNCLPFAIEGSYVANSVLGNDNTITVDVDVTGIGTYQIFTDTLNGYSFSASGTFDNIGIHHVKLTGKGKPASTGTDQIIIHYNSSTCSVGVYVTTNAILPATYTLGGAPGNCMNSNILGVYVRTLLLDTSNKVEISVNVVTTGRYEIKTALINGYSFSASGTFALAGEQTVILAGTGRPEDAGLNNFTVSTGTSDCNFQINVRSDEAEFTLNSSGGKCLDYIVSGTFVKDVFLDSLSRVVISVDVTTPGRYNISTAIVNGYSFTAIGIFANAGVQEVALLAQGQPIKAGIDRFSVSAGSTNCTFNVDVLAGVVQVTGNDYLPLADSNYWVYDDLFNKGNIITRTITGSEEKAGNDYLSMKQVDKYGINDSFFLRRDNDKYFEYTRQDKYTGSFSYLTGKPEDLMFLNELLQGGQYWESADFRDISSFNQPITIKYGFEVKRTNAVIAVNGVAFANVAIIEQTSQLHSDGNPWGATNDSYIYYYAREWD
ncbi:MAG: hypothetical protein ABIR81_01625 [Ginsengibacter sp.]